MATSEQNTLIKKAQPYKINTRSAIRDNMSDIKHFQNASKHFHAQPGSSGSNDSVDLQQESQVPVQDKHQEPVLNLAPRLLLVVTTQAPPNNYFNLPRF